MTTLYDYEKKRVSRELLQAELQAFKPSPEQIKACETYFTALAWEKTVRPIVEGYQTKILQDHQFTNRGELARYKAMNEKHPDRAIPISDEKVITDPNHAFRLDEEDFKTYLAECDQEAKIAGLTHKPGCCPLLEAENMTREARRYFLETMAPISKIHPDQLWTPEQFTQLTDLCCKLIGPFVRSADILTHELLHTST